jgi:hypothetical protein
MKCERAMELLATGNALGRLMARKHAARCVGCGAEAARLARLAAALAAVEPLTPMQRALWTSATTEPRPMAVRSFWFKHVRLAVTAAALVAAAGLAFVSLRPSPVNPAIKRTGSPRVIAETPGHQAPPELKRELDSLSSDLHALSHELAQLSRRAALLDERRDADALARRYFAMNTP